MKNWIFASLAFFAGTLAAETIGKVELQFPPSNYEWKLFVDQNTFAAIDQCFDDEDDDWDDDDEDDYIDMKIFTHREGDALETFTYFFNEDVELSNDDLNYNCAFNETMNRFFANHKINVLSSEGTDTSRFVEWEFVSDGIDFAHGFIRTFKTENGIVTLGYSTTAQKSDYNRSVWTSALNDAKVIE